MWGCTSPAFGIHTASLKDTGLDKVRASGPFVVLFNLSNRLHEAVRRQNLTFESRPADATWHKLALGQLATARTASV